MKVKILFFCFIVWIFSAGYAVQAQAVSKSDAQVWCERWETRMYNAWDRMTDADQCFFAKKQNYWLEYDVPNKGADDATYIMFGKEYRRSYFILQKKFLKLKHRMTHPAKPYHFGSWRPLIRWTWPDHDAWTVVFIDRIIGRESGWQPGCITGSFRGLMQIMNGPLDPMQNLKTAHRFFHDDVRQGGSGWRPWQSTAY